MSAKGGHFSPASAGLWVYNKDMDAINNILQLLLNFLLQFLTLIINFFISILELILNFAQSLVSGVH